MVRFTSGSDDQPLSAGAQQAVIDAVLGQQSVDQASLVQHTVGQIQGTLFASDDGSRGFIAPVNGDVLLVQGSANDVEKFDDVLTSLANANGLGESGSDTTTASSDTATRRRTPPPTRRTRRPRRPGRRPRWRSTSPTSRSAT